MDKSVNVFTFVIVVSESLSCPQFEMKNLKTTQSLLERGQYA